MIIIEFQQIGHIQHFNFYLAWKLYEIIRTANRHIFTKIVAVFIERSKNRTRNRRLSEHTDFDGDLQQ